MNFSLIFVIDMTSMGVFGEVAKSYFESSTTNSSNSTSWEDNFLE
jgi:hypothetical protein